MAFVKRWSSGAMIAGCISLAGCASSVILNPEGYNGGVVRYHYKQHQSPMLSSNRSEAFQKMRDFCGGPYVILKEGPTRGRKRVSEGFGPEEVIEEEWWGMRFSCQAKGG